MTAPPPYLEVCAEFIFDILVPLPIHKRLLQSYEEDLYNTFYQGELTIIFFGDFCRNSIKTFFFSSFNPILNSKRMPDYFRNSIPREQRFSLACVFSVYEVWRHFTTTTKILFSFPFIFKFGNPSKV